MEKNIFLIRTPLQALNAIEAKERFCKNDNNHIIIIYRNSLDKNLIENIIIESEWYEVNYQKIKPHAPLLLFFIRELQKLPEINICFLGDHSTIISYYINRLKYNKMILLEDGSSTIVRAELIENRTMHKIKKSKHREKNIFEIYLEKLLKINPSFYYESTYFTIYNLKNRIDMIENDYRFLKKRINKLPTKNIVFFIGSNLINGKALDREIFEEYISKIVKKYKKENIDFYYILHRKESIDYMNSLAERLGFKCIKFDNIIELELLNLDYIPIEVSTFFSSAVTTLQKLYPSKYTFFYIEKENLGKKFQEPFEKVQIQYEKENIERLSIL